MTAALSGLRVAVTGASGFCGAVIARAAAAAGADVVCLSRRPGPVGQHIPWDAAAQAPDLAGADVVVHAAAAVGDPSGRPTFEAAFHAVNVEGGQRLLDAARARPVVWVSSASVYDPRRAEHPVTEEHPVGGQVNAYGRSKAEGERHALAAGAIVLRPRAVYGPGDPHLAPRVLRRVRVGVAVLPGPDVRLSLTCVTNLADACLAAIGWPAGAYNIADARPYWRDAAVRAVLTVHGRTARVVHAPVSLASSVAWVAEAVARLSGSAEPFLSRYAVDQLARGMVLDISKATARGWRPRRALHDYVAAGISLARAGATGQLRTPGPERPARATPG